MDKCPFCGSKKVKETSFAAGLYELFDCHNIFVQNQLYDKRHVTCYEAQLTTLRELLREAVKTLNNCISQMEGPLELPKEDWREFSKNYVRPFLNRPDLKAAMEKKENPQL